MNKFPRFLLWTTCLLAVVSSLAMAVPPIPFEPDDTLEELQSKIEQNGYSFSVKPTWVYQMSPAEKSKFLNRRASESPSLRAKEIGPLKNYLAQPPVEPAFSWTNYNGHSYIGPVRNQGACGSCFSFGAVAAAEGAFNMALDRFDDQCMDFSESFIAFCLPQFSYYGNHFSGCDGADYDYFELEALNQIGICEESAMPYTDVPPEACTAWNAERYRFDSWYRVPCGDVDAIKAAIRQYGVVDAAVMVTSAFEAYDSGVYEDTNTVCGACEYTQSNHAIALVGWDDNPPEGGGGCWILRNSWGEDWGENGYMRIRYTSSGVACAVCYTVYAGDGAPVVMPDAVTENAVPSGSDAYVLQGYINPRGLETSYYFEYGPPDVLNIATPVLSAGSGETPGAVSAAISGVTRQDGYYFRVIAVNSAGTTYGPAVSIAGDYPWFDCTSTVNGSLTDSSPHWNIIAPTESYYSAYCNLASEDAPRDNMAYQAIPLMTTVDEPLQLLIDPNESTLVDTVVLLYCDSFDPSQPTKNLLAFNDDAFTGGFSYLSGFWGVYGVRLEPGALYWLVVTTYEGDDVDLGDFTLCLGGNVMEVDVEGETTEGDAGPVHSADQDQNYRISLTELLRVIQFFNMKGYHCEAGTEDGFGPGSGDTACTPHDSDYAAQNWVINLSELLRVIQFFNSGGYHTCLGFTTEDGYCPGRP